ncbi:MAG: cytochrome c4 [Burkholderiales bacterium]|jgi:cytochrome c553|nr:cytochrome c4 [Burkholderiales bacterium]
MKFPFLSKRPACRGSILAAALIGLAIPAAVLAQGSAAAKPDLKRGQEIASSICAACHGADGNSTIAANPKLSGQDAAYLLKQLNDYARPTSDKGARVNSIMTGILGSISEADRLHVAAYYAGQPHKPGAARNRDTLELGQRVFRAGVPERGVPACSGCHSPSGAGIPSQYPRLAGQHAEYTIAQLKAFHDGTRRNNLPMTQIAARLTEAEVNAVADYVAGLR